MTDESKFPTPRYQRRESAVQSDLPYVLQRMQEMRDKAARDARYRPGFKVEPPDNADRMHLRHVRKHHCTCGREATKNCLICSTTLCAHCECEKGVINGRPT